MKKISAKTLEEALIKASIEFNCSVTELEYEISQNASAGFLGIGSKEAIIIVDRKRDERASFTHQESNQSRSHASNHQERSYKEQPKEEPIRQKEHSNIIQEQIDIDKYPKQKFYYEENYSKESRDAQSTQKINTKTEITLEKEEPLNLVPKHIPKIRVIDTPKEKESTLNMHLATITSRKDDVFDKIESEFFIKDIIDDEILTDTKASIGKIDKSRISENKAKDMFAQKEYESITQNALLKIQGEIRELFALLPFDIDYFSVSLFDENTILVIIDGADSALLIGERGYRYNAISYLLFNWLNPIYGCSVRLEIAEFLRNQEENIERYLDSIIELVNANGSAKTKTLDGILAYIALSRLRSIFPDKYVSFRQNDENEKYIIINDFKKY